MKKTLALLVSLCFVFASLCIVSYAENPMNKQSCEEDRSVCKNAVEKINNELFIQISKSELPIAKKRLKKNFKNILFKLWRIGDYYNFCSRTFTVKKVVDGDRFKDIENLKNFLQTFFKKEDYFFFTGGTSYPKEKCYVNPSAMSDLCVLYYDLYNDINDIA